MPIDSLGGFFSPPAPVESVRERRVEKTRRDGSLRREAEAESEDCRELAGDGDAEPKPSVEA